MLFQSRAARLLACAIGMVMTAHAVPVSAQSQADLDRANLRVSIAEAEKREAEARRATAIAEAPIAPDIAKYKVPAPTAPVFKATFVKFAYEDATKLSQVVAEAVLASLRPVDSTRQPVVVAEDSKTRALLALSRALRENLAGATKRLEFHKTWLTDRKQNKDRLIASALSAAPMLASIADAVLSYAQILRPQYAFATSDQTSFAEAVMQTAVQRTLLENRITIVEPDNIVFLETDAATSGELTAHQNLLNALRDVRHAVLQADSGTAADEIDARVKAAVAAADDVDKMLAILYTADSQGNTPLDAALRGGKLRGLLDGSPGGAYLLSVKVVSSEVDEVASDRLLGGMRVAAGSNSVVRWRLTRLDGVVHSLGTAQQNSPLRNIPIRP